MDILPVQFKTLYYSGIWHEDESSVSILKRIYGVFTVILIYYTTAVQLIALFSPEDVNDVIACLFLTLSYLALCIKWLNILFRRKKMDALLAKFRSAVCQPTTPEEAEIWQKYSKSAVFLFKYLMSITMTSGICILARPLANLGTAEVELPFKSYHPYDISKSEYFILAYVIQAVAEVYAVILSISFDTMAYGFIQLATGQFELCCQRLIAMVNSGEIVKKKKHWFAHHVLILNIVRDIESFFIGVIAPFFFCCLITLCVTIFKIYQKNIFSIEFLTFLVYILNLLNEAFLYCFTGNELQLKSQDLVDAAYNSDWTLLEPKERKNLLLIMQIGQRDATISCRGQLTLNLDTYVWIMKSSYGTFNLLKGCDI